MTLSKESTCFKLEAIGMWYNPLEHGLKSQRWRLRCSLDTLMDIYTHTPVYLHKYIYMSTYSSESSIHYATFESTKVVYP